MPHCLSVSGDSGLARQGVTAGLTEPSRWHHMDRMSTCAAHSGVPGEASLLGSGRGWTGAELSPPRTAFLHAHLQTASRGEGASEHN